MKISSCLAALLAVLLITVSLAFAEIEILPPDKYNPPIHVEFYVEDGLCGLKTLDGEIILPPQFDSVSCWHIDSEDIWNHTEGETNFCYAVTVKDGLWGLVDSEGLVITPPIWDHIAVPCSNRCFHVEKDGLWGIIDSQGNIISETDEPAAEIRDPETGEWLF